jgi:hypothetical protein
MIDQSQSPDNTAHSGDTKANHPTYTRTPIQDYFAFFQPFDRANAPIASAINLLIVGFSSGIVSARSISK